MHDVMYGMMVTVKSRIVNLVVDLDSDGSNGIMFKEAHEMLKWIRSYGLLKSTSNDNNDDDERIAIKIRYIIPVVKFVMLDFTLQHQNNW
jgi:hypothetical protein